MEYIFSGSSHSYELGTNSRNNRQNQVDYTKNANLTNTEDSQLIDDLKDFFRDLNETGRVRTDSMDLFQRLEQINQKSMTDLTSANSSNTQEIQVDLSQDSTIGIDESELVREERSKVWEQYKTEWKIKLTVIQEIKKQCENLTKNLDKLKKCPEALQKMSDQIEKK